MLSITLMVLSVSSFFSQAHIKIPSHRELGLQYVNFRGIYVCASCLPHARPLYSDENSISASSSVVTTWDSWELEMLLVQQREWISDFTKSFIATCG